MLASMKVTFVNDKGKEFVIANEAIRSKEDRKLSDTGKTINLCFVSKRVSFEGKEARVRLSFEFPQKTEDKLPVLG